MALPLRNEEYYTYADYHALNEKGRWELIDGVAYMMAPPLRVHQSISGELFRQLSNFLYGKSCKVYAAPIGVRLNASTTDDTVLQPDIVVVCDHSKLEDNGINGAPDMVVEILSPSSALHDTLTKFQLYQQAGVREYWIVNPDTKTVGSHILESGRYYVTNYGETSAIPVHILEDCVITLQDVFADA